MLSKFTPCHWPWAPLWFQVALASVVTNQETLGWAAVPLLARGGAIAVLVAQSVVDDVIVALDTLTVASNTAGGALP